jgi:CRISPR/Cas system-associated exonuclease Cas4 (RecB family)
LNEQQDRCLTVDGRKLPNADFNVKDFIEAALVSRQRKPWARKEGVYHPSSIKGCKRSLYYDRLSEPPVPRFPVNTLLLFLLGHSLHDGIQGLIKEHDPTFIYEIQGEVEDMHISGHCDGVFPLQDWVLEIKTVGDASFKTLARPKEDHVWQVHCYMKSFDIPRAQILYVNRNNGALRPFKIFFSAELWEELGGVYEVVEDHVSREEPPPREINYFCNTCKFNDVCKPSTA